MGRSLIFMRKQQANALMKLSGVEGDSAQGKIRQEPGRPGRAVETHQQAAGIHNWSLNSGRESERPIVAKKSGNADGAKGPY
jgi:hypothetical protein